MWEMWEYGVSVWWMLWLGVASPVLRLEPVLVYGLVGAWFLHGLVLVGVSWSSRVRWAVASGIHRAIGAVPDPVSTEASALQGVRWHFFYLLGVRSLLAAVFNQVNKNTELATIQKTTEASYRMDRFQCPLTSIQRYINSVGWGTQNSDILCPVCLLIREQNVQGNVHDYLEEFALNWREYDVPGQREKLSELIDSWVYSEGIQKEEKSFHYLKLAEDAMDHPEVFSASFAGELLLHLQYYPAILSEDFRNRFLSLSLRLFDDMENAEVLTLRRYILSILREPGELGQSLS